MKNIYYFFIPFFVICFLGMIFGEASFFLPLFISLLFMFGSIKYFLEYFSKVKEAVGWKRSLFIFYLMCFFVLFIASLGFMFTVVTRIKL
jgi:hypothetical protein